VIEETPYVMTPEYLRWVMETYDIDYVVHGTMISDYYHIWTCVL